MAKKSFKDKSSIIIDTEGNINNSNDFIDLIKNYLIKKPNQLNIMLISDECDNDFINYQIKNYNFNKKDTINIFYNEYRSGLLEIGINQFPIIISFFNINNTEEYEYNLISFLKKD